MKPTVSGFNIKCCLYTLVGIFVCMFVMVFIMTFKTENCARICQVRMFGEYKKSKTNFWKSN